MAKSRSKSRSPKRSAKRSPKRSAKRSTKRSKSPKGSKCPSKSTAYCLSCRKMMKITGCKLTKSSKGQPMVKGKCEKCGTKVNKFVKKN